MAALIGALATVAAATIAVLLNKKRTDGRLRADPEPQVVPSKDQIKSFLDSGQRFVRILEKLEEMTTGGLDKKWSDREKYEFKQLQSSAAAEFARLDSILDAYAQRTRIWGEKSQEVDIFREALSISLAGWGSGIFRYAIQEVNIVMGKLREMTNVLVSKSPPWFDEACEIGSLARRSAIHILRGENAEWHYKQLEELYYKVCSIRTSESARLNRQWDGLLEELQNSVYAFGGTEGDRQRIERARQVLRDKGQEEFG